MPPTTALCTSCLRTMLRPTTLSSRVLRSSSRAYRMTAATPSQTLYLDFLAPSATRTSPKTLPRTPYPQAWHRNYAVAAAPPEQPSSSSVPYTTPARAILNPRTAEDGTPMSISISPRAVNRLSAIAASDQNPDTALRVTVESGGCHGFQYLMSLTDLSTSPAAEDDTVFEGDKGAKVVIDESSLELLNGSTVDYTMELIGSQFKVTGIPGATSSCGCGTSFDIQL